MILFNKLLCPVSLWKINTSFIVNVIHAFYVLTFLLIFISLRSTDKKERKNFPYT